MAKHKPLCWLLCILVFVGGVNWGLVGLGWLMGGKDLNVVHMLLGSLGVTVEGVVYLLVGLATLFWGYNMLKMKDCDCCKK